MKNSIDHRTALLILVTLALVNSVILILIERRTAASTEFLLTQKQKDLEAEREKQVLSNALLARALDSVKSISNKPADADHQAKMFKSTISAASGRYRDLNALLETSLKQFHEMSFVYRLQSNQLIDLTNMSGKLLVENAKLSCQVMSLSMGASALNYQWINAQNKLKNNFGIETETRRGQLSVDGSRVRKIIVYFSTHSRIQDPVFRRFNPKRELISKDSSRFNAVSENVANEPQDKKLTNMEIPYQSRVKFEPGLYRVEVIDGALTSVV